ncbi:dihydrolipoyl dehydrogenase [Mesorhizobium argentiipisi]|uniref:Dihydrolipoyl dehydrogenase n=1 Tax=Mesorhizobium argentiipisi TaxID=3015175 RepID=A0ABU8KAG0_9HYPH
MTSKTKIEIPDIGDFANVPVIEILVRTGEAVLVDQPILTLESDKATLEVPSPAAGMVDAIHVSVGDEVSKGTLIATVVGLETAQQDVEPSNAIQKQAASTAARTEGGVDCDVVVIGAGPGGYSAAFRAADLGLKVILIEKHQTLGGVCLNVGCIPSKALLHLVAVKEEAERLAVPGISFSPPQVSLDAIVKFKQATVARLTGGLSQMTKMRKVEVIIGTAEFLSSDALNVSTAEGGRAVRFRKCIIAAGSAAAHIPVLPDDPRVVNSTGALELPFVPKRMLVVGGGIIGLEMATIYGGLGATVDVVERLEGLLPGVDRDGVDIWRKQNNHRFGEIAVGAQVTSAVATPSGIKVTVQGTTSFEREYDLVLQSVGRRPNGAALGLDRVDVACDKRGFIVVDEQMRTSAPNIFAIGDIAGEPMLAHKAIHEGHVAAEVCAGLKSAFDATVVPNVAYTNPEIAWVGLTEELAKQSGAAVSVSRFPWAASGRAIANGAAYGATKLIFDKGTKRVVGGMIVGPGAGDMIGEICLAIEMGADATDMAKTIHPHPTLGETIGMAAEVEKGVCTDLPPAGKR